MIHLPKTGTSVVPIEVTLFNGTSQWTGQAANLTLSVYALDDGAQLDFADGTFKTGAVTTPSAALAALAKRAHTYANNLDVSGFPRGHYKAVVSHTDSGNVTEYEEDFSFGLYSDFSLGFSAVYTPGTGGGTGLKLTLWLDEGGKVASDVTAFNAVAVLDAAGTVVANGNVGNLAATNGLANAATQLTLNENTQYVLAADAVLPVIGGGTRTVKVQVGIARP